MHRGGAACRRCHRPVECEAQIKNDDALHASKGASGPTARTHQQRRSSAHRGSDASTRYPDWHPRHHGRQGRRFGLLNSPPTARTRDSEQELSLVPHATPSPARAAHVVSNQLERGCSQGMSDGGEVTCDRGQSIISAVALCAALRTPLSILVLLGILLVNIVVAQLIGILGGSNHMKPVAQLLLLEVLLREVLEVPLRERRVRIDLHLGLVA